MAITVDELSDHDQMELFYRMVQTGVIIEALHHPASRPFSRQPAMDAVEHAGTVDINDLRSKNISPAAAAHQLVDWIFRENDLVPKPEWFSGL